MTFHPANRPQESIAALWIGDLEQQGAGVNDGLKLRLSQVLDFLIRCLVDGIEQDRKAVAQVEAPPAAMTDVIDAAQLGIERGFIVPGLILPRNDVAGRRFQAAFHGEHLR